MEKVYLGIECPVMEKAYKRESNYGKAYRGRVTVEKAYKGESNYGKAYKGRVTMERPTRGE